MIFALIQIGIFLVVLGLIVWLVTTYIPMPPPFKVIVQVIGAIIACVMLLHFLGYADLDHARVWRWG